MNRLILAVALVPALFSTAAMAQTVSTDVTKALWCGTALTVAFSNPPPEATSEQLSEAQVYIDGGNMLIEQATQAHLDAGFTEEQVTTIKSDLVTKVTEQVTGDGSNADYAFEDCVALLPAPSDPTASSAM